MNRPAKPSGRAELVREHAYTGQYRVIGDVDLPTEQDADFQRMISVADAEQDRRPEIHVTLRWKTKPANLVRLAAEHAGVPYQTFIKQAAYERAIAQLRTEAAVPAG